MTNLNNKTFDNTQDWTPEQLISFSNNLASVYGCGFDQSMSEEVDNWTTEQLVNLSQNLAYPFSF